MLWYFLIRIIMLLGIFFFVVVYPLPWHLLVGGGGPIFPFVVHQPASPSIWPAVQSLRRVLSTNPGVTTWCVCGCRWRDDVCRVCGCYRGGTVVMASTLWKYDLRKGDFFVLRWAKVPRVRRGIMSSELLMCAQYFVVASCGYMPRDNGCMYMVACLFLCLV